MSRGTTAIKIEKFNDNKISENLWGTVKRENLWKKRIMLLKGRGKINELIIKMN